MKNSARFTERASGAIAAARDASASLGHSYVGTEHLLLGVAAETTLPTMRANYFIREAFAAAYMQVFGVLY